MKKRAIAIFLLSAVAMTACGDLSLPGSGSGEEASVASKDNAATEETKDETKEETTSEGDSKDKTDENSDASKEKSDSSADSSTEDDSESGSDQASSEFGPQEGLYDRTYLVKEGDGYIYRLTDKTIIEEYDELYKGAFQETYDIYEENLEWMNEGRGILDDISGSPEYSLVDEKRDFELSEFGILNPGFKENETQKLGSNFEMDYGFDINNVGYTYVDLNSDGVFELIFGVANGDEWTSTSIFERVYTLIDGKPVHIFEGGCRCSLWLGDDGSFYEDGSCGAAYSGTWKYHFDPSLVDPDGTGWGNTGFVEDEFLGYWEGDVHVEGPDTADLDNAAKKPEYQISDEEYTALSEEWSSRMVDIDWLLMSDYIETHSL